MDAQGAAKRLARNTFERLPQSVREELKNKRAEFRGLAQLKANQAMLAQRLGDLERQVAGRVPAPEPVADDRFPADVRSRLCTQAQVEEPWFTSWCEAMNEKPAAHRKLWEFAYIPQVLDSLGLLEPGRRGLGFGVGREPLMSVFAARGVEVTATDLDPAAREVTGWARSGQHARSVDDMLRAGVCDPDEFRRLVSWLPADMTAIPDDLRGFDFCWSACALEHLGSLDAGLDFIENSLATLVPGGIAVHTTEFNVDSNDETIEVGPTVVYRERDLLALKDRLERQGHQVAAFDFSRGEGLFDKYIDVPPYADEPVLRFWYAHHTLTSVGIVVRAAGGDHAG